MKTVVETEIKLDSGVRKKYVGRFLGFIREDEYRQCLGNPEITTRIETKPTKDFISSCTKANENNWGLNGVRFILSIKKIDDRAAINKILLFSGRINYISEMKPDSKEVTFVTLKGENVTVKEAPVE